MKPDWKDAPEWARWLAMDKDGRWYWWEKKPRLPISGEHYYREWFEEKPSKMMAAHPCTIHWKDSLEPRPVKS